MRRELCNINSECIFFVICDAVVEDVTGAEGIDALGVVAPAVGDTPLALGVDAGAEGIDALGVVAPAVGGTVMDDIGATEGVGITAELGVTSENVTFRTLSPAQKYTLPAASTAMPRGTHNNADNASWPSLL